MSDEDRSTTLTQAEAVAMLVASGRRNGVGSGFARGALLYAKASIILRDTT
jgi:hypothetical protein